MMHATAPTLLTCITAIARDTALGRDVSFVELSKTSDNTRPAYDNPSEYHPDNFPRTMKPTCHKNDTAWSMAIYLTLLAAPTDAT